MKKLCLILILFLFTGCAYADVEQEFGLSLVQKAKILKIRLEEKEVLKPYEADYIKKLNTLNSARAFKCGSLDLVCGARKQKRIVVAQKDFEASKTAFREKKSYYFKQYLGVLDERQKLLFEEIIHDKVIEYAENGN